MKFTANENVLRVALIVFCIIFGILSICLIALGIVYVDELWWPRRYIGLDFLELPTLIIILGISSLIMSVAGCFCAKTYNRRMYILFLLLLIAILSIELSIAIMAFEKKKEYGKSNKRTTASMYKALNSPSEKENDSLLKIIEEYYHCCNVTGDEDVCMKEFIESGRILKKLGCAEAVNKTIVDFFQTNVVIGVTFSILQVFQIGWVLLLQHSLKDQHY